MFSKVMKTTDFSKEYFAEPMADDFKLKSISNTTTKTIFWTGGFDSTALLLKYVKEGHSIHPIYIEHSMGWAKAKKEKFSQEKILNEIKKIYPENKIRDVLIWDFNVINDLAVYKPLWRALEELCSTLCVSFQYAAFRLCRDVFCPDFENKSDIEISIVKYDELWHMLEIDKTKGENVKTFFKGFSFPLLDESKKDIWNSASPNEKEILKLTFSCESFDEYLNKTCSDRGLPYKEKCYPCKSRILD